MLDAEEFYDDADDVDFLAVVERHAGPAAKERIWRRYSGIRIYVPRRPDTKHPFFYDLGAKATLAVCDEIGGLALTVPTAPDAGYLRRREDVLKLTLAGEPVRSIAQTLDCTERNVYLIRRALVENGELPDVRQAEDNRRRLEEQSVLGLSVAGVAIADMAVSLGTSIHHIVAIRQRLRDRGHPLPRPPHPKKSKEPTA